MAAALECKPVPTSEPAVGLLLTETACTSDGEDTALTGLAESGDDGCGIRCKRGMMMLDAAPPLAAAAAVDAGIGIAWVRVEMAPLLAPSRVTLGAA